MKYPYQKTFNRKELKDRRKELRNNLTLAEIILWENLKQSKLGVKFRRQTSIGNYIVDFYAPSQKIIVELDGENHFTDKGIEYDKKRTWYLNKLGLKVIRFENQEVLNNIETVLKKIKTHLK